MKGNGIMAVYSKPRHPGWDNVPWTGTAAAHPEILKFQKRTWEPKQANDNNRSKQLYGKEREE